MLIKGISENEIPIKTHHKLQVFLEYSEHLYTMTYTEHCEFEGKQRYTCTDLFMYKLKMVILVHASQVCTYYTYK